MSYVPFDNALSQNKILNYSHELYCLYYVILTDNTSITKFKLYMESLKSLNLYFVAQRCICIFTGTLENLI